MAAFLVGAAPSLALFFLARADGAVTFFDEDGADDAVFLADPLVDREVGFEVAGRRAPFDVGVVGAAWSPSIVN